jgi:FixJ family two-component response regulator
MNPNEGTVLIVDDDEAVRDSLQAALRASGFNTAVYANGEALLSDTFPAPPACLLLDLRMPGEDGIEIQHRVNEQTPDLPVIFLSGEGDVSSAVAALKHGALDFLEKGRVEHGELVALIKRALAEHRERVDRRAKTENIETRLTRLTPRERQVAGLVAAGKANKVVAAELGISERTVEIHRSHAMHKLGLRSVAELARLDVSAFPADNHP